MMIRATSSPACDVPRARVLESHDVIEDDWWTLNFEFDRESELRIAAIDLAAKRLADWRSTHDRASCVSRRDPPDEVFETEGRVSSVFGRFLSALMRPPGVRPLSDCPARYQTLNVLARSWRSRWLACRGMLGVRGGRSAVGWESGS